jgi:hypothetical protein
MTTRSYPDTLWIPLAELQRAGLAAPPRPDNVAMAIRPLGEGMAAVDMNGALVYVIVSPTAWQRIQATDTAWRKLFHWALRHIDTPTLRQMNATAEHVLNGRPSRDAACRQS